METTLITCKNCGGECPSDAQFCIECGESLSSATGPTTRLASPTCPGCGSENLADARFCAICGRPMSSSTPAQPWAQPHMTRQPHLRPQAPTYTAPAQIFPRPVAPPITPSIPYTSHSPRRHRSHSTAGGFNPAMLVLLIGLGVLFVMKIASFPLIMLVIGAAFLVRQAERGRFEQALRTVLMVGAGIFVISNPRLWPLLLVAFGVMKLLGHKRHTP